MWHEDIIEITISVPVTVRLEEDHPGQYSSVGDPRYADSDSELLDAIIDAVNSVIAERDRSGGWDVDTGAADGMDDYKAMLERGAERGYL